jgi:hypothetical protein
MIWNHLEPKFGGLAHKEFDVALVLTLLKFSLSDVLERLTSLEQVVNNACQFVSSRQIGSGRSKLCPYPPVVGT